MRSGVVRLSTLLLAGVSLSCDNGPTRPPDSAACADPQVTFVLNNNPGTFNEVGTLTEASCLLGRGSYADRYELTLNVAAFIEINVGSTDFDAFLILRNEDDGPITSDDDNGPDSNARLAFTMQPGTYYILATTYADGALGNYTLSVNASSVP